MIKIYLIRSRAQDGANRVLPVSQLCYVVVLGQSEPHGSCQLVRALVDVEKPELGDVPVRISLILVSVCNLQRSLNAFESRPSTVETGHDADEQYLANLGRFWQFFPDNLSILQN